jgi:hypothetical protein
MRMVDALLSRVSWEKSVVFGNRMLLEQSGSVFGWKEDEILHLQVEGSRPYLLMGAGPIECCRLGYLPKVWIAEEISI